MKKKRLAFTLAEILITIGIIGVVAAMTLPTLRMNIENKILSAKTKQVYALLSQSTKTYMAQNGLLSLKSVQDCTVSTCTEKTSSIQKMVESTLKYVKKCDDIKECFSDSVVLGSGTDVTIDKLSKNRGTAYILADGYAIYLSRPSLSSPINVIVDVDGGNGSNEFGRDVWTMKINNEGVVISGSSSGSCNDNYDTCFDSFIKNGMTIKD